MRAVLPLVVVAAAALLACLLESSTSPRSETLRLHRRTHSPTHSTPLPPPPPNLPGRFSDAANTKGSRGGGSEKEEEEVVTIRGGRYLEVSRLKLQQEEGEGEAGARLEPLLRQDTFSALRSMCKIRPVGASKVGR